MNPRLILASLSVGIMVLGCGGNSGPTSTTTQYLSTDGGRGHGEQDDQDDQGRRDGQAGQGREDDDGGDMDFDDAEHHARGDGGKEMDDNEHEDGGDHEQEDGGS